MYFSSREKKLLKLLLENTVGIPAQNLQELLQISKRTLYREISSIEETIKPENAQIINERKMGYRLVGSKETLDKIRQEVEKSQEIVFDNVQRQSALVANLLLAEKEEIVESLAVDFAVSPTTIHNDLQQVEKSLAAYGLSLYRKKARGILVVGPEEKRRQILSNIIYSDVNEYEFFSYLAELTTPDENFSSNNFFLNFITPRWLYFAKNAVLEKTNNLFIEVTDNQLQQVITSLALTLERIAHSHWIVDEITDDTVSPAVQSLAEQIMGEIKKQTELEITDNEVLFFTKQLEGVNYKKPQNIFLDNFDAELSYQVRELIRLVSQQTQKDFRKDDTLFYDLLTHLAAAFKRIDNQAQLAGNPLLEKILTEYPRLRKIIQDDLKEIFTDHRAFLQDELAYIVIHFAASLERNPVQKEISALVLCSSGIGTAKILESRLNKYIPEIEWIEIAKISQMGHIDFKEFDLILSTIFLPEFSLPYKVISPLLLDDEIREIKQELQGKQFSNRPVSTHINKETPNDFEQVYEQMKVANELLTQFSITEVSTRQTLEKTLDVILDELEGVVVEDPQKVRELLIHRHKTAPIGIPNTHFALFHSANTYVKKPYFAIFDLSRSVPILGMDRKPMELTRLLLMLAPDNMSTTEERLLGRISNSVIESDVNIQTYQYGDEEAIYERISSLFITEIKDSEEE
ncbi:BglG family transcription antiterminator [Tetragenococcus muriaticus]|uniref:PTS system sugar-specific IIA component n=1 Tax=Tetragenococcus muriaticus 3MR10-3 TaxID=1302648 RepID=A0A091C7L6_9ENTE|nr:transcription antiterminator [Tetragenococcus muriaticus]KFN92680.1 PTS system sugar-specific IIA component [Tetragenococcus muriaticus 3MR10-3]